MDRSPTKQCTLLYQTTDYDSSQTTLHISNEITTFLRNDLHLARVEKKLCNRVQALSNLANNGVASQSSEYGFSGCPCLASRAIDKNPAYSWSTGSCASTGNENDAWWLLDMQREVDVEIVRLSNKMENPGRMSNFQIRIGMNPTDFSQNALCFNISETAPSGETTNYPCLNVTRGRYVSIQRYFPYVMMQVENFFRSARLK